jgi:polyketide biosynthesis enoyl-CoA hydratase PksI
MNQVAVEFREQEPGIALVIMQDRVSKNTFSKDLVVGLFKAFGTIEENPDIKVIVLTGYDSYFCMGGTQEGLLAIQEGRATFAGDEPSPTGKSLYSLPIECEIPVISAMQGHAVGGGFAFGLASDFVIFSRESIYATNFMKYGFTPGMGATCILPEKLGISLAEELLLGAENYRGAELEKRGIPFRVFPRKEVLGKAFELARVLVEKPRLSLVTLKKHLVAGILEKMPGIIKLEIEMHEKTFPQPEVRERLMSLYGK